jgi:hypothetical protein
LEPPVITVVDSVTGGSICDATIEAVRSGAPALTLVSFIPPAEAGAPGCEYFPASLGPDGGVNGAAPFPVGTYTLMVSRPGFRSVTIPDVASLMSSCEEQPPRAQDVNVALDPA